MYGILFKMIPEVQPLNPYPYHLTLNPYHLTLNEHFGSHIVF